MPGLRQAIIWTNAEILLIGTLERRNVSEILIEIQTFPMKKMRLKISSVEYCSFHLGLIVLNHISHIAVAHTLPKSHFLHSTAVTYTLPKSYFTQHCSDLYTP